MKTKAAEIPGNSAAPVDLSGAVPIGRGWKRSCYIHPDDPARCIKVATTRGIYGWGWRDRLTTLHFGRDAGVVLNRREWRAYGLIGEALADYIPRYYGPIATSLGDGLEVDLVRDPDGTPSMPLRRWLLRFPAEEGAQLREQFDALFDLLLARGIWMFDLNMVNFLVQEQEDCSHRIWLIDLKRVADNKEIFQIGALTRGQKRRKLERRIARFRDKFESIRTADPESLPDQWHWQNVKR